MNERVVYCAGLFDGEGWIDTSKFVDHGRPRFHCTLAIGMQCLPALEFFRDTFGVGSISFSRPTHWVYRTGGRASITVAEMLYPHLIVKREQIRLFLELAQTYTEVCLPGGISRARGRHLPESVWVKREEVALAIRALRVQEKAPFQQDPVYQAKVLAVREARRAERAAGRSA